MGTLGSEMIQNALKLLYNLNSVFIPSFKEKQPIEKKEIIINDQKEYMEYLNEIIKTKAIKEKRAVLVIFKYIANANNRKIALRRNGKK